MRQTLRTVLPVVMHTHGVLPAVFFAQSESVQGLHWALQQAAVETHPGSTPPEPTAIARYWGLDHRIITVLSVLFEAQHPRIAAAWLLTAMDAYLDALDAGQSSQRILAHWIGLTITGWHQCDHIQLWHDVCAGIRTNWATHTPTDIYHMSRVHLRSDPDSYPPEDTQCVDVCIQILRVLADDTSVAMQEVVQNMDRMLVVTPTNRIDAEAAAHAAQCADFLQACAITYDRRVNAPTDLHAPMTPLYALTALTPYVSDGVTPAQIIAAAKQAARDDDDALAHIDLATAYLMHPQVRVACAENQQSHLVQYIRAALGGQATPAMRRASLHAYADLPNVP